MLQGGCFQFMDAMSIGEENGASIAASSNGTFDLAGLLTRCMDDAAMAAALLQRFTSRLPTAIADLESLLAARQWSQASSKVHTLKGEAGSLGAIEFHAAACSLEQALGQCRQDAAAGKLVQLESAESKLSHLKAAADACLGARASALAQLDQGATGLPQRWQKSCVS
jgi:HPt (histidine-containing phosphotransfer) domain-containing protein